MCTVPNDCKNIKHNNSLNDYYLFDIVTYPIHQNVLTLDFPSPTSYFGHNIFNTFKNS